MRLEDEVRRLVVLFGSRIDDRDFDSLAPLLSEDCVIESLGEFRLDGRDVAIAEMSAHRPAKPGRHVLGPTVVQFDGAERASAWTDMMVVFTDEDGSPGVLGTWRYHDRLAIVDQTWVFTHRYLHRPAQPLTAGAPAVPSAPDVGAPPPGRSAIKGDQQDAHS